MDMLNLAIIALNKCKTLNQLFEVFKNKVRILIKADRVHVLMSDTNSIGFSTNETFNAENIGYSNPVKVEGMTLFRALPKNEGAKKLGNNDDFFKETLFGDLGSAFKGVKGKQFI
jgi:hypothetical protein